MTEKLNFIMTGSIAGGRGLEALLVLKQLPLATPNFGRCVVVVWEAEACGDVFDEIKRYPVQIIVAKEPKRTSFGFMEQQYKSLLAAMPHFEDDDILVRIRTDYNFVLNSTIALLNKVIAQGQSLVQFLRGRIVCGEISILHPGRIQEFNFAATKKSLSMIGWCESFFTTDYNPVDMEPEFRWFGLQFVQADPLFHYCYENRNMRQLMRGFFDTYYINGQANPDAFPSIIKYISWRISNIAREKFICCLNIGGRNIDPATVFNAKRADISVYHGNIPDIRLTSHSTLADVAGAAPVSPSWEAFTAEAKSVANKELAVSGSTIELFEQAFGGCDGAQQYWGHTASQKDTICPIGETPLSRFVEGLCSAGGVLFSSFRDYPSDVLLAFRNAGLEPTVLVANHIMLSDGLREQMVNRYASFCVTTFCSLAGLKQFETAAELLFFMAGDDKNRNLSELVGVVANRAQRFPKLHSEQVVLAYEVPKVSLDYNMILDFYCSLLQLKQAAVDGNKEIVDTALSLAKVSIWEVE